MIKTSKSKWKQHVIFSHLIYKYFEYRYKTHGTFLHWEPDIMPDQKHLTTWESGAWFMIS
ncbi:MAG: hypothetical protein AMS26_12895 [Bacteroides sp. SM23_62]|nr:MAG: hypothetical protein AMS26_12895 [Bacteroides sp. SM23_62]